VLVGAARDKFGKLTRPFHGIIAGLSLSVYFKLRSTTLLILPRYSVQLQYVVSRSHYRIVSIIQNVFFFQISSAFTQLL